MRGTSCGKGDQPRRHSWSGGTICSAANGPGGPAVATTKLNGRGADFGGTMQL